MATETLPDGVEVETIGNTNTSIISIIGSRGAAAAVGGPAATAGRILKEQ